MGPRNKLAKITGGFLSILNCCKLKDGTVGPKMPSVTDNVIDCPNKINGCATASECLLISVTFPWKQIVFTAFALIGWVGDSGKTCASSWFVFLWYPDFWHTFAFLKSNIIAGGCYIFRTCAKNFFSFPIKFLFCTSLGWSATKRDGQTSSENLYMLIKREYFRFFQN